MAIHVSRDTIVKYNDRTELLEAKNFLSQNSNYMGKRKTKIHVENKGSNHVNKYTSKEWKEVDSIANLVEAVLNICSLDHMICNYGFGGIVLLRVCHEVR